MQNMQKYALPRPTLLMDKEQSDWRTLIGVGTVGSMRS